MIKQYSRVRLISSQYLNEGIPCGSEGYIIDIYENEHYDVEFSNLDDSTLAILTLTKKEFEKAD